jgi:hypothetical protein
MTGVHWPFCSVDMHVAIISILALHVAVHSANGAEHCCCDATLPTTTRKQKKVKKTLIDWAGS